MSGHNYSERCPNCGQDMESYSDHKPLSHTTHECLHCGLLVTSVVSYMSLEDLNNRREEHDMDRIMDLPHQQPDIF